MRRCWFSAALILCVVLCFVALVARAQENLVDRDVKALPGRDVPVGTYINLQADCTAGVLPAIRLVAQPAHGTVAIKRGTLKATNLKQCLATEVPAFVAYYRSTAGFSGTDEFILEVSYPSGYKQTQRFRVNVSNKSNGAQGI